MNILIENPYMRAGGAENRIRTLLQALIKRSDIDEVHFMFVGAEPFHKEEGKLHYWQIRNNRTRTVTQNVIDKHNIDVVQLHNNQLIGVDGIRYAQEKGIPTVWVMHDFWPMCWNRFFCPVWHAEDHELCYKVEPQKCIDCVEEYPYLRTKMEREVVQKCDVGIVPSNRIRNIFYDAGFMNGKMKTVDPWIDLTLFTPQPVERKPYQVLYASGNYIPHKGIKVLLRAWDHVQRRLPESNLIAIGDQRCLAETVALSKKLKLQNVNLIGGMPQEQLRNLMSESAVTIFPSIWEETIGLTWIESLACVLPDTKILTINGIKEIKDIKENTMVFTHEGRCKPVTKVFTRKFNDNILHMSIGETFIKVTPEHPILTQNGWRKAGEIFQSYRSGKRIFCRIIGRGGIFSSQNIFTENQKSLGRRRNINTTIDRNISRCSENTNVVLDTRPLWGVYNKRRKRSYPELGFAWKEEYKRDFNNNLSLLSSKKEFSKNSFRSMQQTSRIRATQHFCGRLDLAFKQSRRSLSYQFCASPKKTSKITTTFKWAEIRNIKEIPYKGTVWNLSIKDDESYIANDIIVHNCGTPVICSKTGSIPELLKYGGEMFEPRNHLELAETLMDMLMNVSKRVKLATEGHKYVHSQFKPERAAEDFARIYYELSDKK